MQALAGLRHLPTRLFDTGQQQRRFYLPPFFAPLNANLERLRRLLFGKIKRVEVGLPTGYAKLMGDPGVTNPPEGLDYDTWCGPAAVLPYMRARHHRWWRGHRAYGGGSLMDFIGHHNDIAHWAERFIATLTRPRVANWPFDLGAAAE